MIVFVSTGVIVDLGLAVLFGKSKVLFSRGILRDTSFAQTLLSMYMDVEDSVSRPLEIVTVNVPRLRFEGGLKG